MTWKFERTHPTVSLQLAFAHHNISLHIQFCKSCGHCRFSLCGVLKGRRREERACNKGLGQRDSLKWITRLNFNGIVKPRK
jgi:hypothetical protein